MSSTASDKHHLPISSFRWLGFDMDHTLAAYKPAAERLIFHCFIEHLVNEHKYPASLLTVEYDFDFSAKGIVLDKSKGNFISLDDKGRVTQAFHGHRHALTPLEIREVYGTDRKWSHYDDLCAMRRSSAFMVFTTYFDVPTISVWAELVDLMDAGKISHASTYDDMTIDIMNTFEHLFEPDAFVLRRGGFFTEMTTNPDQYLVNDVDGLLHTVCTELRQSGHRLALITNSRGDFAQFVMDYVYGLEWRSMFDLVVMQAMKPKFFNNTPDKSPFYLCSNSKQSTENLSVGAETVVSEVRTPLSESELGSMLAHLRQTAADHVDEKAKPIPVLAQGTSTALAKHIGMGACKDEPVLYFGDHLHADVVSLPEHWYAAAIVEEMNMDSDERTSGKVWGSFFTCAQHEDVLADGSSADECSDGPSHWLSLLDRHALVCMPGVGSLLAAYHQGNTKGVIAMQAHHAVEISTAAAAAADGNIVSSADVAVGVAPPSEKIVTRWFPSVPCSVHDLTKDVAAKVAIGEKSSTI